MGFFTNLRGRRHPPCPEGDGADQHLHDLADEYLRDRRRLRWALVGAAIFHAVLLLITFPELGSRILVAEGEAPKLYVVRQVRFSPPPPRRQAQRPKVRAKKIPIPDPTPQAPEPLRLEELEVPEIELPSDDIVFGIPDAPAPGFGPGQRDGAVEMGRGITPPVKIYAPDPRYTEEARKGRIEGTVILRAIIDEEGKVISLRTLKELPLGLTESAVETVRTWLFEPATRGGEKVAVYYMLSVRFRMF